MTPSPKPKAASKALPPMHVEFRLDQDGGRYFQSMTGHKIMAIDFYLAPEHTAFLGSEQVTVNYDTHGIRIIPSMGGTIVHRVENELVRASIIFENADETLFYHLFALTGGKPILVDGASKYLTNFDVSMKTAPAMGAANGIMLVTDTVKTLHDSVPVSPENNKRVNRERDKLRALPFPERLIRVEKLVGELSVLMESLDDTPGIDAQLVIAKSGRRLRARLRRS